MEHTHSRTCFEEIHMLLSCETVRQKNAIHEKDVHTCSYTMLHVHIQRCSYKNKECSAPGERTVML